VLNCTSCKYMKRVLIDHSPDSYAFVCDKLGKIEAGVVIGNVLNNALLERGSGRCGVDAADFQKWEGGIQNYFNITINSEGRVVGAE
jgi:hypothetical protein